MRFGEKLRESELYFHRWRLQPFYLLALLLLVWGTPRREALAQFCTSPIITNQPASLILLSGDTAAFRVGVYQENCLLTYRWVFDGLVPIFGGSNATLNIFGANSNKAGIYFVVVSNVSGVVTSSSAGLTVVGGPEPAMACVAPGQSLNFRSLVAGFGPFGYQWRFNGEEIPGETNSVLTLANIEPFQAGAYAVTVTNLAGSVTTSNAFLSVQRPPRLGNPAWGPDGFHFLVMATPNLTYLVQTTHDWKQWNVIATNTAPADGMFEVVDPDTSPVDWKCYRVFHP